jgi:hypothetical protein
LVLKVILGKSRIGSDLALALREVRAGRSFVSQPSHCRWELNLGG